eukprot:Nitzschia sp. Nitz4//scaffold66_size103028//50782//51168//NITZ4_004500-RA/size103028-processed-gene-0.7-mRNA-1//1//CDS//3329556356//4964//frame0
MSFPCEPFNTNFKGSSYYPVARLGKARDQRIRFALFIKILFKRLAKSGDLVLHHKAKVLLYNISARSKQGGPNSLPLIESLEAELRPLVGERHWRLSHLLMREYLSRNNQVIATPQPNNMFHRISHAA